MSVTTALPLPAPARVLACGAYLKNRACRIDGATVRWSAPHGDLGDTDARIALEASVRRLGEQEAVDTIAHDLHPDFPSTVLAQRTGQRLGLPVLGVQHHHAHIAAVVAEHGLDMPVIGLALDGVGLGTDGQAWGGGCELALACTVRVASERAHLGQPEILVGIIPGAGGTQRLGRLVGPGRAAELVLSGRIVEAREAAAIGLVEAVLPVEGFLDAVLGWVAPMAANPRAALAAGKRAVVEGGRLPLADGLALEGELFVALQTGDDALTRQDAVTARYAAAGDDDRVTLDPS